MSQRERIDRLLVSRGLAPTRERAQRLIMSGGVRVGDRVVDKPGTMVDGAADVRVVGHDLPYVSRGGLKLEAALRHWRVDVAGRTALDVGASTGGFTDCLLQHGAARVVAVDVGYGQFDWKLRGDPRVRLLERTNVRHATRETIGEAVDLAAVDVSFISLRLILPVLVALLDPPRELLLLVKPQFEVGKGQVGKGGIVRDEALRRQAVEDVAACARGLGLEVIGSIESPIVGAKGNREFLLHAWQSRGAPLEGCSVSR
jgi:23S rRNA (cytidine1920-2'-O)/16S rRNA (cytidine1409-2'-O)-methyltransferase